jgi:hypothetical protein
MLLLGGRHTLPEDEMEALDVQDLLEYARAAVAVIRGLVILCRRGSAETALHYLREIMGKLKLTDR